MAQKSRITITSGAPIFGIGRHAASGSHVMVMETVDGSVTWLDRLKAYYKALIVLVGSVLTTLSVVSLPAPEDAWVAAVVSVLTVVMTVLKANETWVSEA